MAELVVGIIISTAMALLFVMLMMMVVYGLIKWRQEREPPIRTIHLPMYQYTKKPLPYSVYRNGRWGSSSGLNTARSYPYFNRAKY